MNKSIGQGHWSWLKRLVPLALILVEIPGHAAKISAPWVGQTLQGAACQGGDPGNFGPFNYVLHKDKLPVVENYHFTPQVEQLQKGESTGEAIADIDYTLTRFPNHHRALYSAIRYSLGEAPRNTKRQFHAECYLQRAINFAPTDPVPYMLYGIYLHRLGKVSDSLDYYETAENLAPEDPNLLYNYGLALFDEGRYAESYRYARRAYASGVELPALKRKLQKLGHWE